MAWKKLGLIIEPDPGVSWMTHYTGPSFVDMTDSDVIDILVTGRDHNNVSRIGRIKVSKENPLNVVEIQPQPLFDIGQLGTFDESGVSYPWLVKFNNKIYMYYVGWVAGGKTRFQNATGLCQSVDNGESYQRVSRAPILPRSNDEPIATGSVCVLKENGLWRMWYTSFDRWEMTEVAAQHYYNIKYAESNDGLNWDRQGHVAIDFKDEDEHTIGKPMVLRGRNKYEMWYAYRGGSDLYRIGYADSSDGVNWTRKDSEVGIDVSETGWDSEMIEYAYVFDSNDKRYMIYNGNNFGKSGLGLAQWVE